MIDNEIIVPLKCLVMNESDCRHCKLKDKNDKCQKFLYSDVLGLIDENNQLQAELDDLKRDTIPKLQSSLERANRYGLQLEEENKMFKAEFTRFAEVAAPPYLLINTDVELTAEMKEAIKTQRPVIVPDNEGIVIRIDKASIRAAAFNEFAEKFLKKVHDKHYLLSDRINSKDYGMFTKGIEQAVNETKEEMEGDAE